MENSLGPLGDPRALATILGILASGVSRGLGSRGESFAPIGLYPMCPSLLPGGEIVELHLSGPVEP